ncbi:hypothetical protein AGMMS49975_25490 [Clostridia bacterium]|nr:hypothetical protein AGMMS49975_25490 [Clostridia bacterium]
MKDLAVKYYTQGYNCSACIFHAAAERYGIKLPRDEMLTKALCGITAGFGIGSICSVLIGAIFTFGLLFDENTCKSARIRLLDEFAKNHGGKTSCAVLKRGDCKKIIAEIAEYTEQIIDELSR